MRVRLADLLKVVVCRVKIYATEDGRLITERYKRLPAEEQIRLGMWDVRRIYTTIEGEPEDGLEGVICCEIAPHEEEVDEGQVTIQL